MSLIQLPPGMTPEQYWASPEGKRAAEQQRRFAEETEQKQRQYATPNRRPPPSPGLQPAPPRPIPPPAPGLQPAPMTFANNNAPLQLGAARPAQDPYASSTKARGVNDIAKDIESALASMAPEIGDAERRMMAADLAREYRQQRGEAVRGMTRAPVAPPTEQMEFDQAYAEMQSAGRTEERMKSRLNAQLREERVAEMKKNQLEQRRVNARLNSIDAAAGRPQWQMEGRRPARGNAPAEAAIGPRPGMPGVGPPAGMAQPIPPPSQGSAYGGPDKQAMYWQLVDGGMEPSQAKAQVNNAFFHAPR